MAPSLPEHLITTKHASDLSGYTPDYLSRLIRSGKIIGKKIGHTWLVDSSSLEAFLQTQKDRKLDRARALAHARVKEYRAHHTIARRITRNVNRQAAIAEKILGPSETRSHAFALSLACALVISAATIAHGEVLGQVGDRSLAIVEEAASGFRELTASVPVHIADSLAQANDELQSRSSQVALRTQALSARAATRVFINPDLSFLQLDLSCKSEACATNTIAFSHETPNASAFGTPANIPFDFAAITRASRQIADLAMSPHALLSVAVQSYAALGSGAYADIARAFSFYDAFIRESGASALAVGTSARDWIPSSPRLVGTLAYRVGRSVADLTHAAIGADVSTAYALSSAAPESARTVVTFMGATGAVLASASVQVPSFAAHAYLALTQAPSRSAPALAEAVFGAEYAVAEPVVAGVSAVSEQSHAAIIHAGQIAQLVPGLSRDMMAVLIGTKNSATAFIESLRRVPALAAALPAAQPSLTDAEQVALTTYQTIHGLFNQAASSIAILWAPAPVIVLPQQLPAKVAITTASSTRARVSSNIYPTYTTVVQGVSQSQLDTSITSLKGDILATVAGMIQPVATQTVTNTNSIQYVNMIQDLSNLVVRNGDFRGGSLTNGTSVSATNGSFANLSAGAFTVGTTTISGDLSVSGALTLPSPLLTTSGGTGTSSPSGILYGDNGATGALQTVAIGSGLTFSSGTLSATGSGGGTGTVGTSTTPTIGELAYWTSNGFPSLLGSIATTAPTFVGPFSVNGTLGNLVGGTNSSITYTGLATTSQPSSSDILVSNGGAGVYGVATSSATLGSEFSYSGTFGSLVGGANGTLTLSTNGIPLTKLAQVAANTILGNNTGTAGNIVAFATSSLGIALSDTTGTLAVNRGGTGLASFTPNALLYANAAGDGLAFAATSSLSIGGNAGTVTNGVYTTTFNSLFDPRFVTDLAATTSIASITTLPSLSLPYSQLTGTPVIASSTLLGDNNTFSGTNNFTNKLGLGSSSPFALLSVNPTASLGTAPAFVVGSSSATSFVISSAGGVAIGSAYGATAVTDGQLAISNKVRIGTNNFAGSEALSVSGTTVTSGIQSSTYNVSGAQFIDGLNTPYTGITIHGRNGSTLASGDLYLVGGTTGSGSGAGGRVRLQGGVPTDANTAGGDIIIDGGAPTGSGSVGNILLATNQLGKVGVGTTSPWASLSIHANNGSTNTTLFAIGSSTASALTTLFSVDNTGKAILAKNLEIDAADQTVALQFTSNAANAALRPNGTTLEVVNGANNAFRDIKASSFVSSSLGFYVSASDRMSTGNNGDNFALVHNSTYATLGAGGISIYGTVNTTQDLGIARNANGVLEVNNGTPGTLRDITVRSASTTGQTVLATLGGNVGVGTTSPSQAFSVQGNGLFSGNVSLASLTATGTVDFTGLGSGFVGSNNGTLYTFASSSITAASSTLLSDNNTFSGTNNFTGNLGIGTTSPASKLDVEGGNVSFGDFITSTKLSIKGGVGQSGNLFEVFRQTNQGTPATYLDSIGELSIGYGAVHLGDFGTNTFSYPIQVTTNFSGSTSLIVKGVSGQTADILSVKDSSNSVLVNVSASGNLGIGTTSPFAKLSVAGDSYLGGNLTATGTIAFTGLGSGFVGSNNGTLYTFASSSITAASSTLLSDNNTFSGINIFTNAPKLGALAGLVGANAGNLYSVSTSTLNIGGTANNVTGVVGQANGGTGIGSYNPGDILYADAGGNLAVLPIGSSGNVLKVSGTLLPTWALDTGGTGGTGGGSWSTTTSSVAGELLNFPNNNTDIVTIGGTATTSAPYWFDPNILIAHIAGKLGVGTTSPSQALSVQGNGLFSGNVSLANLTATGTVTANALSLTAALPISSGGTGLASLSGNQILYTNSAGTALLQTSTSTLSIGGNAATATALQTPRTINGVSFDGTANITIASTTLLADNNTFSGTNNFTGNLGVGSSSPWAQFSVNPTAANGAAPSFVVGSSSATNFIVTNSGKVGVGTVSPANLLDVNGIADVSRLAIGTTDVTLGSIISTSASLGIKGGADDTTVWGIVNSSSQRRFALNINSTGGWTLYDGTNNSGGAWTAGLSQLNGNVGIGTTSPWAELSVNPNGITGPAFAIGSSTGTSFVVTNAGRIGVGTTTPLSKLAVSGGVSVGADYNVAAPTNGLIVEGLAAIGASDTSGLNGASAQLLVAGSKNFTNGPAAPAGQLEIYDTTASAQNVGGAITFVGNYLTTGNAAVGAAIDTGKEDTGIGTFPFYMRFLTRPNGAPLAERLRITSTGLIGIGTTSPYALLSVATPNGSNGALQTLFAIGSSTQAGATTTLFSVSSTGNATLSGALTANSAAFTSLGSGFVGSNNGTLYTFASSSITAASSTLLSDNNTFSGTNTFTNAPKLGSLSGVVGANSGALYSAATSSATLGSEFSYSGTFGSLVGGANGTLTLSTNGIPLTKLAQVAANTILGNNTGTAGNIVAFATSSLGIALSDTTGTLAVNRGGTGLASFTPNALLYANAAGDGLAFAATSSLSIGGNAATATALQTPRTINGVSFDGTANITIASTTLLADNNTFSGTNNFTSNFGVGTSSPASKLSVVGSSYFAGALLATSTVRLTNYTNGALAADAFGNLYTFATSTWTFASSTLLSDNNTFSGTNTFTNAPKLGALAGLVGANAGNLYSVSTSTLNIGGTASNVTGTVAIANGGSGSTTAPVGQLLYGGSSAYQSVATTSATLGSEFSYSGTFGSLVGGANGTLTLATNGTALTKLAQIAANSILGNATGSTGNITAIATSSLFGTGTGGQVLAWNNGVPQFVATTTFSSGLTYANGNVTNSGLLSLTQNGGGTAQTGAITFATSSQSANGRTVGLNITNSGTTFTFTPTLSGTLTVNGGGTGLTSVGDGQLVYGNGTSALVALATSTGGFLTNSYATGRPVWSATSTLNIALANTTGTLAVNQGGTGVTSFTANSLLYSNSAGTALAYAATSTLNIGGTASNVTGTVAIANGGTATTTFYSGGLVFGGATLTQAANTGNNALAWDTTNFRFGIGSTSPWAQFSVNPNAIGAGPVFAIGSSTGTKLIVANSGNVGIGTTSPLSLFSVGTAGNAFRVDSSGTVKEGTWNGTTIAIANGGTGLASLSGNQILYTNSAGTALLQTSTSTLNIGGNAATATALQTPRTINGVSFNGTANITIASTTLLADNNTFSGTNNFTGNLGIGTSSPYAQLSINPTASNGSAPAFVIGSSSATKFAVTNAGAVQLSSGSGASPALQFVSDSTSGLYSPATGSVALVAGGQVLNFDGTEFYWSGASGAPYLQKANTAGAPTYSFNGSPNTGLFNPAANVVAVSTNSNETARFDANGNFGLGTTTPWAKLSVNSTASLGTAPQFVIGSSTATDFIVTNAGRVGIGTTNPGGDFEIVDAGTGDFPGGYNDNLKLTGSLPTEWFHDSGNNNGSYIAQNSGKLLFGRESAGSHTGYSLALDSAGRAGFGGNTSPTYTVDVTGNGHFTSFVDAANFVATSSTGTSTFAGAVGIGTANPASVLEVVGTTTTSNLTVGTNITWRNNSSFNDLSPYYGIGVSSVDLGGGAIKATRISDFYGLLFATNGLDRLAVDVNGNIDIGTTTTSRTLTVQTGGGVGTGGIKVIGGSTASGDLATVELIGQRGDANTSGTFSGTVALAHGRSDAAITSSGAMLGRLVFGGNADTAGYASITYPAGIAAVTDNTVSASTSFPTALAFYTGSTGKALSTANTTIGTEALRISSSGYIGSGTTSPWAQLSINPTATNGTAPAFAIGSSTGTSFVVTNAGKVGIGTSTPGFAVGANSLVTSGDVLVGTGKLYLNSTNGFISRTDAGNTLQFAPSGATVVTSISNSTTEFGASGSTAYTVQIGDPATGGSQGSYIFKAADHGGNGGAGNILTVRGGIGSTATAGTAGGALNLQGGAAAGTANNVGGNVYIDGGLGSALGATGSVLIGTVNASTTVGIGTTSPYALFALSANSINGSGAPTALFVVASTTGGTATSTLFTIANNGNVGIGTTSPSKPLDVAGNIRTMSGTASVMLDVTGGGTNAAVNLQPQQSGLRVLNGASSAWVDLSAKDVGLSSAGYLGWAPNTNADTAPDTAFSRLSAGTVAVGTGAAGNTGGTFVANRIGLGTTTPYAQLSILATSTNGIGSPTTLFAIASTTGGTSTSTLLTVLNTGNVGIGTTSPGSLLSIGGNGTGWNFYDNATTTSNAKGINLANGGCFAVNGVCIGGAAASVSIGSAVSGGTDGSVLFIQSGQLQQDNANFFWNDSTNSLGLGSTTPWAQLSINPTAANGSKPAFVIGSSTATNFIVTNAGYVGIGTTSPESALQVGGRNPSYWSTAGAGGQLNVYALNPGVFGSAGAFRTTITATGNDGEAVYGENNVLGDFDYGRVLGGDFEVTHSGHGYLTDAFALDTYFENGIGTTTNAVGLQVFANFASSTGQITNNYGIRLEDQTAGVNNYNIWSGPATSSLSSYLTSNYTTLIASNVFTNTSSGSTWGNKPAIGAVAESNSGFAAGGSIMGSAVTGNSIGAEGLYSAGIASSTGSINYLLGLEAQTSNLGKGTVNSASGIEIDPVINSGGGAITYNYGLSVDDQTAGVNNYNIWSGPATSSLSAFLTTEGFFNGRNVFTTTKSGATFNPAAITAVSESNSGYAYGIDSTASAITGDAHGAITTFSSAIASSSGTVGWLNAYEAFIENHGSGTVTEAAGLSIDGQVNDGGGSITQLEGILVQNQTVGNTNYGIKVDQAAGANNYALYAGGGAKSYFAGNIGIGTTSPSSLLSISNTASTAANTPLLAIASTTGGVSTTTLVTVNPRIAFDTLQVNGGLNLTSTQGSIFISTVGQGVFWQNSYSGIMGDGTSAGGGSSNYIAFKTANTERARFDNAGNFGIGTTTPWAQLSINPTATNGSAPSFVIGSSSATSFIVSNSGKIGVGTTSPSQMLSVQGNTLLSGDLSAANITATGTVSLGVGSNSAPSLTFSSDSDTGLYAGNNQINFTAGGTRVGVIVLAGAANRGQWIAGDAQFGLASAPTYTFLNDTTSGIYNPASQTLGLITNSIERVRVDSSGKVGIGTTSPFALLSVATPDGSNGALQTLFTIGSSTQAGATTTLFSVLSSGKVGIGTTTPAGNLVVNGTTGQNYFQIASSTNQGILTVNQNGYVGVGTSNPNTPFVVNTGLTGFNLFAVTNKTNGNTYAAVFADASSNAWITANDSNNTTQVRLNTAGNSYLTGGNVGIGTTTPSSLLAVGGSSNGTASLFSISSSTASATTTVFNVDSQGRVALGYVSNGPAGQATSLLNIFTNGTQSFNNGLRILGSTTSGATSTLIYGNSGQSSFTSIVKGGDTAIITEGSSIGSSDTPGIVLAPWNSGGAGLRIDGQGNVGVATSTPWGLFSVNPTASNGSAPQFVVGSSTGTNLIVTNSGKVGVGTTTPWGKFTIALDTTNPALVVGHQGSTTPSLYVAGTNQNGYVGIGTSTPNAYLTIDNNGKTASSSYQTVGGINEYMRFDPNAGSTQFGNQLYIDYAPTTTASTLVGQIVKIVDSTQSTSTVRGLEVQADRGTNTQGENTAISAFGRTFGVRAVTDGDAGSVFAPAALYAETKGSTQGNAGRFYSASLTSGDLVSLFTDTSTFTGNGLVMNFGNSGGSFTGNFLNLENAGTTKFITTSTGQTGIGTSSPWAQLSINPDVGNGSAPSFAIGSSTGTKLVVTNAGNVGIGTTSPATLFEIGGASANVTLDFYKSCSGFTSNANGVLQCTASDQRLKQNIAGLDSTSGLDAINALQPVSFYWNPAADRGSTEQYGFIAQQVEQVFPNLVSTTSPTALTPDGTLTVNYEGLISPIVRAIQQLDARTKFITSAASTTVLSIDASNNVAIGTTTSSDKLTVGGTVLANAYEVPVTDATSYTLDASTTLAILPASVLTVSGNVDLYKLATYNASGVSALAAKVDGITTRLVSLENRVAALESGAVTTASNSPSISTTSLASALASFGAFIQNGLAQFGTLVADRFVAAADSSGTSSAGTVTILAGNTVAQVTNAYVTPTTKVFVTFNSQITGSWWVSDKQNGSYRVQLSEPQTVDVSFDYFLVQTTGQVATSTPEAAAATGPDTVAPVIALSGDNPLHLAVGTTFTEPGVTVTDNSDGTDSYTTFVNGIEQPADSSTIDTSSPTTYIITYKATDAAGNSSTVTRSVIVGNPDGTVTTTDTTTSTTTPSTTAPADTTPPVVTLIGSAAMQLNAGDSFTDPGATATDDVDGDLTNHISVSGAVDTTTAGNYTLTYSATDAAGNIGSASRLVTVAATSTTP